MRKYLLLIVEQNFHYLELLNYHLKSLDMQCICTKYGVRGLGLAKTHQPDLILLDVTLSDLTYSEFISDLKAHPHTIKIPIIALIGFTQKKDYNSFIKAGADDCVTKPYNFLQLQELIDRYLNQPNFSS